MYEVVIINRRRARWTWQLIDQNGRVVLSGTERSREAAKYAGERALFFDLLIRPQMGDPPQTGA